MKKSMTRETLLTNWMKSLQSCRAGCDAAAIADDRYEALVTQFNRFYFLIGGIISAVAIYVPCEVQSTFCTSTLGIVLIMSFVTIAVLLYVLSLRSTSAQLMVGYRGIYIVSQISFRSVRIYEMLLAHDRYAFGLDAAANLDAKAAVTTYTCFAMGWLIGMFQPPRSLAWRVVWALAALLVPLSPPSIAFCITGGGQWLDAAIRIMGVPTALGFFVELVQRHFVKVLLRNAAHNEIALELPQLPLQPGGHSERSGAGSAALRAAASSGEKRPLSLADFEPVGILGIGGSGQVRLMRNLRDGGKLQALKSICKMRNGKALGARGVAQVEGELSVLRAAHAHPFIVSLMGHFEDANYYHFVITHAANGTLETWMAPKGLSEASARGVAAEVLLAVEHLHSLGVLYRDLKPDNVLVRSSGHILLADFGISKQLCGPGTSALDRLEATSLVGTPGYMAPEVLAGMPTASNSKQCSRYSFPADWWSLGVLCHVMIACEELFSIRTILDLVVATEQRSKEATAERLADSLSTDSRDLILGLLVFDPAHRLGSTLGADEIKAHPFFSTICWDALLRGAAPPPLPTL